MSTGAAIQVGLLRTDGLGAGARADVRALLAGVFAADWTEPDREHCLGGVHALVEGNGVLVGHGAVMRRQLRAGYVEPLAVRCDRRGQGRTSGFTRGGIEPTGEDASARVLPVTADLDRDGELTCDRRAGDPW